MRVPNPKVYRHPKAIDAIVHETIMGEEVEWYENEHGGFYPLTENSQSVPEYSEDKVAFYCLLKTLMIKGRSIHMESTEEGYSVYITKKSRNYVGRAKNLELALCNAAIQSEI